MKSIKVLLGISMCMLLVSCAKVPELSEDGKTARSRMQQSSEITDIFNDKEQDLSEAEYLTKTEDGYVCKLNIKEGDRQLNIDAIIENTGEDKVSVLQARPLIADWNMDRLKKAFFGKNEQVKEVFVDLQEESTTVEDEDVMYISQMPVTNEVTLRNEKGDEAYISDIQIYYDNNALSLSGKETTENDEWQNDISDAFTLDMAWKQVQETFQNAELGEIHCISGMAMTDQEYAFDFTTIVNGLPLVTSVGSVSTDELVAGGHAVVMQGGIEHLDCSNTFWETEAEEERDIMNIAQFVELLKYYMKEGIISGSGTQILDRCELCYFLKTDDWEKATLIPVWRVYIPVEESIRMNIDGGEGSITDLVIDATTGEILRKN